MPANTFQKINMIETFCRNTSSPLYMLPIAKERPPCSSLPSVAANIGMIPKESLLYSSTVSLDTSPIAFSGSALRFLDNKHLAILQRLSKKQAAAPSDKSPNQDHSERLSLA